MPTSARINERYEKRQILGQGGMGVVWWAYDYALNREVSLKTIRDVRDKTALDLFRKECDILAGMAHPNIVEIYDVGAAYENGEEVPYFVMPLLRGMTLDKLIQSGSSRLTAERCVDILTQVCRGLQAAHDHGLVHRDLKPSNIFVLQDDSVKIIDFGVAHLVDVHSTVNHGGTLLYMSPEQIMLRKPTPASDLFSLGVVAFEALTGRRPFEASNRDDIARRIVSEIPPPAYRVDPAVSLPVSQVIHKAMAKLPYQRFASAKEFSDNLQKALRNDLIETFSPERIEPRVQRIRKALEEGELDFAKEVIDELESEAVLHPELDELRKRTESILEERAIQQLLDTAHRRFDEEEYQLALQKIQEILDLDAANTDALLLRGLIENKRSNRQIEDWLRLARQHLENYAYSHARDALQKVLDLRPKETNAQQLLLEVDRREQEHQQLLEEKGQAYQGALDALDKGDLSSALSGLERVLKIDRRAPDTLLPDRTATYQKIYNQVRSEHNRLANLYHESRQQLENGDFAAALATCEEVLERSPSHALFQSLKFDIEDRQRQEVSAYIAKIDRDVHSEPDLVKKIGLLEEALRRYPGEGHFERSLRIIKSKQELVDSIVSKARAVEDKGLFSEALNQWEILRNVYDQYPGLEVETDRVNRRKQHKERADLKGRLVQNIDRDLSAGNFSQAIDRCKEALADYPGDAELETLEAAARQGSARLERALVLLQEAETALAGANPAGGLELLRQANQLNPGSAAIRQRLLDVLLDRAKSLIDADWQEAEKYLQQALDLDPGNALAHSLTTLVKDRKNEHCITEVLSRARSLQAEGDVAQAVTVLGESLQRYPEESRLTALREQMQHSLEEMEKASGRKRDLEQLRAIQREAETVFAPAELESLFQKTQALSTRYLNDPAFTAISGELRQRVTRAKSSSMRPSANVARLTRQAYPHSADQPATQASLTVHSRRTSQNTTQSAPSRRRRIPNAVSNVLAEVRLLPGNFKLAMRGKLPWRRLAPAAAVIAAGTLLLVSLARTVVPRNAAEQASQLLEQASISSPLVVDSPAARAASGPGMASPTIQLMTEIEGTTATLDGVPLEDRGNGLLSLDQIPEGEQTLQIIGADGANAWLVLRMTNNSIPEVLDLNAVNARVFAAATFQDTMRFFGFAPGETVRAGLLDDPVEELGPQGLQKDGVGTGSKIVFVEYGTDRGEHEVNVGSTPLLSIAVTPDRPTGTLEVVAGSTDVQVFVNGRRRRFVPVRGTLYMGLTPGNLRVRVERDGYFPEEQEVVVRRGKSTKLIFDLRPEPRIARLTIRNAAGVEIAVANQPPQRPTADGTFTAEVAPGRQRIQFVRQGFRPLVQEIDFTAGEPREIDLSKLNFERLSLPSNVTIQAIPDSTEINVLSSDGRKTSVRSGVSNSYPEGRYSIEAGAAGYEQYSSSFEVKGGQPQMISISLRKKVAEVAKTPAPPAMSGWDNASEWALSDNGYYVKKDGSDSLYKYGSGVFEFVTPCKTRNIVKLFSRGGCRANVFLAGGSAGTLTFEINGSRVKRKLGQRPAVDKQIDSKLAGEMRIRVRVNSAQTMIEVNGEPVDTVEGDYSRGRFGISSIEAIKDFRYAAN